MNELTNQPSAAISSSETLAIPTTSPPIKTPPMDLVLEPDDPHIAPSESWTIQAGRRDLGYGMVHAGVETVGTMVIAPSLINFVQSTLNELEARVTKSNWDDADADPVAESTFDKAREFLQHMPMDRIGIPEIDATSFGEIVFSWDTEHRKDSFVVAIQPSGEISVAGIFNKLKVHGYMGLGGKDQSRLHSLIRWIF